MRNIEKMLGEALGDPHEVNTSDFPSSVAISVPMHKLDMNVTLPVSRTSTPHLGHLLDQIPGAC